jgi:CspA family cold shock protein
MVRELTEGYVVKGGRNPKRTSEVSGVRITGKVKFFADEKGFGFILADGGSEYFVHRTDLEAPGRCNDDGRLTLVPDERVSFEVVDNPRKAGGKKAARVQVL